MTSANLSTLSYNYMLALQFSNKNVKIIIKNNSPACILGFMCDTREHTVVRVMTLMMVPQVVDASVQSHQICTDLRYSIICTLSTYMNKVVKTDLLVFISL